MHRGAIVLGVLLAIGVAGGVFAIGVGQSIGVEFYSAGPSPTDAETPSVIAPTTSRPEPAVGTTASPSATPTPTPTPTPSDPDRDNLPTRYEESIGTDPMHKTVLLAVNYTSSASPLSAGDRSFLKASFEELKVVNPDGTTGITLHVVEEWNTTGNVTVNRTALRQGAVRYLAGRTRAKRCRHHYLVVGAPEGRRWGIANTGGWTSIVKSQATGFSGSREDVIVHEVLHNLVGKLDVSRDGVLSDGTHTKSGWLQPVAEMGGPSSLHPATREKLNDEGFANAFADQPGCL
jgi:hypothetical protein